MLVIRLQRTGRSGHAMFRIIVQDSRRSPTSGKVVAFLGNYDPHSKKVNLDKDKAAKFIANGAQPSNRMISILKAESVKLPKWVEAAPAKKKSIRNPEKRRSTAPEPKEKPAEAPAEEVATETTEEPAVASEQNEPAVKAEETEATEDKLEEQPVGASDEKVEETGTDEKPAEAS